MTATQGEARQSSLEYPPATTSMAFPEDPFSEPSRKSPAQQLQTSQQESLSDWAKSTRFTVLNHFSHVTNVARNGAHTLLSSPLFQQDPSKQASTSSLGTSLLHHGPVGPFGPNDPDWKHSELAKKSGTGDFDSAHVYLARWAKIVAEEGEANRRREAEARRATLKAAIDVEESELGNFEVWHRLPHIDRPEATRGSDNAITQDAWKSLFDDSGKPTITFTEMKAIVFQQGFGKQKQRMTGIHWDQLDSRAECWSFLLGAQEWSETLEERRSHWISKVEQYWQIKTQDLIRANSNGVDEEQKNDDTLFWKEQKHRIHVDCLRVDRKLPIFRDQTEAGDGQDEENAHMQRLEEILLSYVAFDRKDARESALLGGYVQGMSDLCATLYVVSHADEAKTFWLLVGLMNRLRVNFYTDQSGMKSQLESLQKLISIMDIGLYKHLEAVDGLNLFFCFRWLLVSFKREFEFPDILMLWEAIWSAECSSNENLTASDAISCDKTRLSNQFQIFIALAILEQQRDVVIKYLQHFDEILQYMNGLSGQIDVDSTIAEAQVLCLSLRHLIMQQDENSEAADGRTFDENIRTLVGLSRQQ